MSSTSRQQAAIEASDLHLQLEGQTVVRGLDLAVPPGAVVDTRQTV